MSPAKGPETVVRLPGAVQSNHSVYVIDQLDWVISTKLQERERQRQIYRHTYRQTDSQTVRQTDRQTDYMHMALLRVRDGPISARVRPVQAEPEQCHMHFLARYQFSTNLNQYNNRKKVFLDIYLNLQRFRG